MHACMAGMAGAAILGGPHAPRHMHTHMPTTHAQAPIGMCKVRTCAATRTARLLRLSCAPIPHVPAPHVPMQAHIHAGAPGEEGPVLVWLLPAQPLPALPLNPPLSIDGKLSTTLAFNAGVVSVRVWVTRQGCPVGPDMCVWACTAASRKSACCSRHPACALVVCGNQIGFASSKQIMFLQGGGHACGRVSAPRKHGTACVLAGL